MPDYQSHQIAAMTDESSADTFDVDSTTLTDEQITYLKDDYIRHMLVRYVKDAHTAATWSNNIQAYCEKEPFGIPSNNSSDPRNYTTGKSVTLHFFSMRSYSGLSV